MKPMIRMAAVALLIFTPIALSMGFSQDRRLRTPSATRGDSRQHTNAPPAARVPVIRSAGSQPSRDLDAPAARVPSLSTAQKIGYFSAALNLPQVSETSLAGPYRLTTAHPIVAGRASITFKKLQLVSSSTKAFATDTDGVASFGCGQYNHIGGAALDLHFLVDEPDKPLLIDFVLEGPPGAVQFTFSGGTNTSSIVSAVPGGLQHVPIVYVPTNINVLYNHWVRLTVLQRPDPPGQQCKVKFHSVEITPLK